MRKVLSKCLNLIFYSFIGTIYPNFEQKHLLLLLHEFLAFKRKATLVDFVDYNFFPSQWDQDSLHNPYDECGFYV